MTTSLGDLPTRAEESPLPMRQTSPHRMPTRYFKASGRAIRYYTLLKGYLEVIAAKGNLITQLRNSATGCSLKSYPGHIITIIIIFSCVSQLQRCKILVYSTEHQVATHNLRYPEHILGFSLFQEDMPFARFRSRC